MNKKKTVMSLLNPDTRKNNFEEVALGYTYEEAVLEAARCLDCKNPKCVSSCPVSVNIPSFLKMLIHGDLDGAYSEIYKDNILPAICGRVCPQEKQCEGACIVGIKGEAVAIGALERYVGDYALSKGETYKEDIKDNGIKIAIVGSGPAGLACAASMRRMGYSVDIYEALHEFGGVLKYGIPDFRLPKNIVEDEISQLKSIDVNFIKNVIIGKSLTIDQLLNEYNYEGIFIGSGAGLPRPLGVPGENLTGIFYANEFLTRVNLMKARANEPTSTPVRIGDNVAVVGGGNVAMDAARTAKRLGAKNVFILYRRDMDSLPARLDEIHHALEEDIDFRLLLNPVEFIGENYIVNTVKCEIMELGEPDNSGRRRPLPTGRYKEFEIDSCIVSIGQSPNPIIKDATKDLKTDQWGRIVTENHQTSIPGVFAGGDVVSGAATVILAMGAGKDSAVEMDKHIKAKNK